MDSHPHDSQNVEDNGVSIISVFEDICYYLGMIKGLHSSPIKQVVYLFKHCMV